MGSDVVGWVDGVDTGFVVAGIDAGSIVVGSEKVGLCVVGVDDVG